MIPVAMDPVVNLQYLLHGKDWRLLLEDGSKKCVDGSDIGCGKNSTTIRRIKSSEYIRGYKFINGIGDIGCGGEAADTINNGKNTVCGGGSAPTRSRWTESNPRGSAYRGGSCEIN